MTFHATGAWGLFWAPGIKSLVSTKEGEGISGGTPGNVPGGGVL